MDNLWKGQKCRLRAATEKDTVLFIDKNGDYDTETLRRYDYIDFPFSQEQISHQLANFDKNKTTKDEFLFVIETLNGEVAGLITAFDCSQRNGTFKFGLFVLENFRGAQLASEAVNILLNYYFNELRYNKANVYIYDYNTPSLRFHEKLGFIKEGQLRQMAYSNGAYHDTIYMGLLKDEFNKANPLKAL